MYSDLQTFLDYLGSVHTRTRRVIDCITADALEWVPAPGRWSAGDPVRHLAAAERWMYAETVAGRPSAYVGHSAELASGLDRVRAYHDTLHAQSREIFASLTPEQWTGRTRTPAGVEVTTWKWLRAMLEHEAHHRGQLYFTLGMLGVTTPPIYGLTETELIAHSAGAPNRPPLS
ncbi:MAG: DinB family protein [Gemmatimonadota bacterium]